MLLTNSKGMKDSYNLQRFVDAQTSSYETALKELHEGYKRGHWMWYIFPQLKGLGRSAISQTFALASLKEAQAYLEHPVLGSRLKTCTQAVLDLNNRTAQDIFGHPDVLKFKSSMTLFAQLGDSLFSQALNKYFEGVADKVTLRLLRNP